MRNWWRYSRLRFYIKNSIWNYKFWLLSKKQFKNITYIEKDFFSVPVREVTKRKFEGYLFKGKVYSDNPGMPIPDRDVWIKWNNKGLI